LQGVTLLYKEITATNFVLCEDALDALTVNNKIVFEKTLESDQKIASDKLTTEEMLTCCGDLRVLGKREFRQLLRWRDAMKDLIAPKAAPAEESSEEDEEDEETRLGREMEGLAKAAAGREKRAKRKEREKKAAYQRRIDMKMDNPDDVLETQEELGLFSMKKSRAAMIDDKDRAMEQADAFAENPYSDESSEEEEEASSEEEFDAEGSTKGPRARRLAQLESEFDQLYESYCERTGTGSHARVRKKRRGKADGGDEDDVNGFVPDLTAEPGEDTAGPRPSGAEDDEKSAEEDTDEAARAARAERWFSQELFSGVPLDAKSTEAEAEAVPKKQRVAGKGPAAVEGDSIAGRAAEKEGFEEVAVSESDSDSDGESDLDSDGEAEVAAMGQLLLKKKIRKEDLIDACYHKCHPCPPSPTG
jgi:AdoMet-dependent rRNA methyltransferase SPB1